MTVPTRVLEDFQLDVHAERSPGRNGNVVPRLEVTPRHERGEEPAWTAWVSYDGGWLTLTAWVTEEVEPRFSRRVHVGPVPYDGPMGVSAPGSGGAS